MMMFFVRWNFFVLFTILLVTFVSSQEDACFTNLTDPFQMFATATPYGAVNDMNFVPVLLNGKYYNVYIAKLRGLSQQANCTDRAAAAGRRS